MSTYDLKDVATEIAPHVADGVLHHVDGGHGHSHSEGKGLIVDALHDEYYLSCRHIDDHDDYLPLAEKHSSAALIIDNNGRGNALASVTLVDNRGTPKYAGFRVGELAARMQDAIALAEKQPGHSRADFELRALRVPELYGHAIWLHWESPEMEDKIIPIHSSGRVGPSYCNELTVVSPSEYLAYLREIAETRARDAKNTGIA